MAQLKLDRFGIAFGPAAALQDVSFAVAAGQRVGLIGETGAGKTLIVRTIAGLLPPDAKPTGTISFDEVPLEGAQGATGFLGRRIGVLLQDAADSLDPMQTGLELLHDALASSGVTDDMAKRTDALLLDIGLASTRAELYPADLHVGERQLLMVAVALAGAPELLVADMPIARLDTLAGRRVLDLIDRHCKDRGMSLLLVSHEIKAVAMLCTRLVVLHQGRIVEAGEKADVLGHPKHEFTRALLSAGRNRARTLMRTPIGGTLLDVRKVRKRYRRPDISVFEPRPPIIALDDVSFAMRAGESMGLVGPAGSGKTTLVRIVAGLERASKGELEFDSRVYHGTDLSAVNRGDISMVFRQARQRFNPRLTLGESVAEPLRLTHDEPMEALGARIVEVVTAVGLSPDTLQRTPPELSSTELYRFGLARALITRPKLIVLDEPIADLDIAARGEMLVLLNRLRADFGLTFLVASRDLDIARAITDRLVVMDMGRVVETGTPAQLLENPQHNVTKRLVAAALPDVGIVPVF